MRSLSLAIVAAAVVLSTGCWQKKKKPVVPPAPAPVTQPAPAAAPKATKPETPPPPSKPVVHKPKVQPAPRPQTPAPTAPMPQLGAMISPAQRQQLDAVYTVDLKKARAVLKAINNTPLDAQRSEMAGRVRSFIKQAEEFHALDLAAAAEMAQRARVLAEDLEKRSN